MTEWAPVALPCRIKQVVLADKWGNLDESQRALFFSVAEEKKKKRREKEDRAKEKRLVKAERQGVSCVSLEPHPDRDYFWSRCLSAACCYLAVWRHHDAL